MGQNVRYQFLIKTFLTYNLYVTLLYCLYNPDVEYSSVDASSVPKFYDWNELRYYLALRNSEVEHPEEVPLSGKNPFWYRGLRPYWHIWLKVLFSFFGRFAKTYWICIGIPMSRGNFDREARYGMYLPLRLQAAFDPESDLVFWVGTKMGL